VEPERVGVAPEPVGAEPERVGAEPERVGVEPEPVGVAPEPVGVETIVEGEPAEDDLPVGPSASVEPIVAQEARDRATSAAPATHQDAAVGDTAPMTYEASAEDHHVAAAGPEAAAGPDRPPLTTMSPRRRDSRPGARRWAAAAVIALLVVAGLVIVAQVGQDSTPKSAQTRPTTTPGANAPKIPATTAAKSPVATASKGQPAGGAVPAGWRSYSDPAGFQVAYPPTWSIRHDGTLTDFSDPATSTYLRIDHRSPPAPTPDGPWYELEPHFAASNPGYQRIGITRTTFHGYPAAVWEYTYLSGSLKLHAIDLGMIVGDHAFGFNFQTTDAAWTQMQPLLDSLENSFRP
jgi:hypothetical protein